MGLRMGQDKGANCAPSLSRPSPRVLLVCRAYPLSRPFRVSRPFHFVPSPSSLPRVPSFHFVPPVRPCSVPPAPSFPSLAGTGPNGITADVIVVHSFEELDARSAEVPGTQNNLMPHAPLPSVAL